MRIRKCASKLLGATIGYFSPPPPRPKPCSSPAWDSQAASAAAAAAAAAGILCQLNRSPWDLVPNDQNAVSQEDEDADPAADDDDRGAAANRIKPERKPVIKSDVKIKEEEEKVRKKVKRKRMEKGIDSTVATKTGETTAAPLCKKSDGKGWHCKRPAHLPHSLCHYHLTQLRSYTNNSSYRKASDQATRDGDKHRKKDAAGDGNNFYYYYYSGFGPWRGKRRGSNYSINGDVAEEGSRENSESMDGHDDALVTGDDEEDSEEEEDKSDEEEEEGNCRKRGRKPVKARSLKSLL